MVEYTPKQKIVLLGDSGVGKTCIAQRFATNTYTDLVEPTIGASFYARTISAPNGKTYQLELWDTAGQERYKSLIPMYYKGATAAIIVYDVTSMVTFEGAKNWIKELKNGAGKGIIITLCGNKADLDRKVSPELGKELATQTSAIYCEVSAKSGDHITDMFDKLLVKLPKDGVKRGGNILTVGEPEHSSGGCC